MLTPLSAPARGRGVRFSSVACTSKVRPPSRAELARFARSGHWLGGLLGRKNDAGRELNGGPQMIQLSLDGRRLYVTNSLYSTWDNQFYPGLRSWLLRVNCSPEGGMEVEPDFFVDFHERPDGPARAHEVRLQGGDCTTEIFQ